MDRLLLIVIWSILTQGLEDVMVAANPHLLENVASPKKSVPDDSKE